MGRAVVGEAGRALSGLASGASDVDAAALAEGRRLAGDRFPRDRPRLEAFLHGCAALGAALTFVLAVVLERLVVSEASRVAVAAVAAAWLVVAVGLVVVPCVCGVVCHVRQRVRRDRAARQLQEMARLAASGGRVDPRLRAFSATVATAPFAHVPDDATAVPAGAAMWDLGPVGALAWTATLQREQRRPEDPRQVLGVARVVELDPSFPFVRELVCGSEFGPFERSWRAALSCVRAADLGLSADEVATLAGGWDGDIDGFDQMLALVANRPGAASPQRRP